MIRGTKRQIAKPVNVELSAAIHNRFDIEVVDSRTGEVRQRARAFNVVCDALWTRLFTPATYFNYILYGSGTGTPAASDTALFNRINGVGVDSSKDLISPDYSNGVVSFRRQMTIDENTSVGETITEVGIGYDATHIVTHAMLQDMNGNPITITKTDTDIITFYATVFVHFNTNGYNNGNIIILSTALGTSGFALWCASGIDYNKEVFPCIKRGVCAAVKTVVPVYSAAAKTVTVPTFRYAVGEANASMDGFSFFNSIYVDRAYFNLAAWKITGESVGTGDGTTVDYQTAFPVNSAAKVYVNGVEDATATIDIGYKRSVGQEFWGVNEQGEPALVCALDGKINFHTGNFIFHNRDRRSVNCIKAILVGSMFGYADWYSSADLQNWTYLGRASAPSGEVAITETNAEFFKADEYGFSAAFELLDTTQPEGNIHFQTPPAAGAVITADYVPDCIPKDTDHVFDLSLTVTLGEYTGS